LEDWLTAGLMTTPRFDQDFWVIRARRRTLVTASTVRLRALQLDGTIGVRIEPHAH